jgi:hypothetical protein
MMLLAVLLAACSNPDPPRLDETTQPDVTTLAAPTTTAETPLELTPATVEPVAKLAAETVRSTQPGSTDAALSDEDAVLAVHARVMGELFARDERVDGPEARLPLAEELTTGALLQRIRTAVLRNVETGERDVSPGYDSNVVSVSVESRKATVIDCSQDRGMAYSAAGTLLVEADDFWKMRRVEYVDDAGAWRALEIFAGGDERCDPES